ncbi:carboxypeptidase-like regulatory domain-containing protein [Bernardetia sp. Wsw4-3y2]|uniref:TonB-dependent receptor n=1 Tax=Bernardetia sp. Wsw4-3y2 TaxID=3127471 RepID=UPI0030CF9A3E
MKTLQNKSNNKKTNFAAFYKTAIHSFFNLSKFTLLTLFSLFLIGKANSQTLTQTISGKILEEGTGQPVPFANVIILDIEPLMGVTTDSAGNFKIKNVPIGRHILQVSYVSFQTRQMEVIVNSVNETVVEMRLKDDGFELEGVVITAQEEHGTPQNAMILSGGRTLSMEEARRYAGGFDDPARLASAFAGVATSEIDNNGVVVRGNSPKGMLWRIEGVEIPNPNHFADLETFGGGGLTALSSHLLANSDFLLSAFPAEYGNALSGVFDINIRNGKTDKRSHAFQVSALGVDVASEGAFKQGKEASYIFNYRYSMLGLISPLLPENAGGTNYQDFTFKINLPTKKAGTFSIWGISALDKSGQFVQEDSTEREYESDFEEADNKQYMGAVGLNHRIHLGKIGYLNTNFTSSGSGISIKTSRLNIETDILQPSNKIKNNLLKHTFSSYLNVQLGKKHINRTGIITNLLQYDIELKQKQKTDNLETLVKSNDQALHFQAYTQSLIDISPNFTMNIGSHFQYLAITEKFSIEPRLSFEYRLPKKQTLTFGYGLHSRVEPLYIYLVKDRNTSEYLNKDLNFTKAHHFTLGYQKMLSSTLRLKVETYYQELFNVPVIANTSSSLINLTQSWFINDAFVNKGKGRNYGIDITAEKFLDKGLFYLFTLSLFNSTYQGGDKVWRDTRFNQQFVSNFLVGKEWSVGNKNNNVLGLSLRIAYQGGQRIMPVDYATSISNQEIVFDENRAFEEQKPNPFLTHVSFNYQKNKSKHRSIWSLQVLNALGAKEFYGYQYNFRTNRIDKDQQTLVIPNIAYKIEF